MPKDRLFELKEKSGQVRDSGENDGLLAVLTQDSTQEHFFKFSQKTKAIQESLWAVQEKIGHLKTQHGKILLSPTTETGVKIDLEQTVKSISQSMTKIGKNIKDLNEDVVKNFRNQKINETEYRMLSNAQSSLVAKFQVTWEDMCAVRTVYETNCKNRIKRQMEIAGYSINDDDIESAMITGIPVFSKEFSECEAAKLALRDQEDRLQELLGLEKSIQEMHDLFIELNLLVQCQGETIDRIEVYVDQAEVKVADGKDCLDVARKKQSSFRKKKIICISILSLAFVLAIVITVVSLFG